MRVVLCDDEAYMQEAIEALVARTGHEVAGVADTSAAAMGLIEVGRPDAVILDLALGFDSDFDLISSAIDVDARVIVFSYHADAEVLQRYTKRPIVIAKPDLTALEQALGQLANGGGAIDIELDLRDTVTDRRHGPPRAATGPIPTGIEDAQAFFEAVNDAQPGDGMLSLDIRSAGDAPRVATDVARHVRETDRVLALSTSVRVYLPGGGEQAARALMERVAAADAGLASTEVVSIVVAVGEDGPDAFERLRHSSHAR